MNDWTVYRVYDEALIVIIVTNIETSLEAYAFRLVSMLT